MELFKKKRNCPVATLIKNFKDKKSGKVTASRNELQRRFDYLDWSQQKRILLLFLNSSTKTDRQWAYVKLRTCWDKCFEQPIKEIWEHEKDMQVSALIVRSFPMEYVEGNKELLTIGRNYYYYCLRRSDDRSFVADESLLKEEEYIHFLNVGRSALPDYYESIMPSDEKILDLLFRMARRVLIGDINPGYGRYWDSFFPMYDIPILNNRVMCRALSDLCEMGCMQAADDFCEWCIKVKSLYDSLSKNANGFAVDENGHEKHRISWYYYNCLDSKYKHVGDIIEGAKYYGEDDGIKTVKVRSRVSPPTRNLTQEEKDKLIRDLEGNNAVSSLRDKFDFEIDSFGEMPSIFDSEQCEIIMTPTDPFADGVPF